MTPSTELLAASDDDIDDALRYADPMALRGLLYQLTGDESIAATEIEYTSMWFFRVGVLTDPSAIAVLQRRAADLLRSFRDGHLDQVELGPIDRLRRSVGLVAGRDIPDRDMPMWLEELGFDPWARAPRWPAVPGPAALREFQVLVIGTGMSGLNAAIHLKRSGIPFTVLEKNPDVGGTWYENRYPGARVDAPSRGYSHVYGTGFDYPYPFCPQSENQKYLRWLADGFGVRPDIEFGTEVTSLVWDDGAKLWEVCAAGPGGPRRWRVNAVISAVGFLSRPSMPDLPGASGFGGQMFHTACWPDGLDVTGKRVAVVGSGASGYQLFPELARSAAHAYLFQRTPSWVFDVPGYLKPYPPEVNWLERNVPYYRNFMRFRAQWLFGPEGLGTGFTSDPEVTRRIRHERLEFMTKKLGDDPELLERMIPAHPPMASRPVLVDDDYSVYDALLRDDATLVTSGIERLTEKGIRTVDGTEHDLDVIVLATGFRANDFLWPMDVTGVGGRGLDQLWETDGPRAYLGTMLPGFPNLFTLYGPNGNPLGGPGVPTLQEEQTRFALSCLQHLVVAGKDAVEVTEAGYRTYNRELDEAQAEKIYIDSGVRNYYTNEHGRSAVNCPFDGRKMWEWLRDPTGDYARTHPESINASSGVRPYFGQDLTIT